MAKIKKKNKKRGRPTKYLKKYDKEIVKWMSRGFSITSFAGKIGVNKDTLYEWIKTHKSFSDSIKKGKMAYVKYWESIGMLGMMGKIEGFNATMWIFNMKNRLGWSDKMTVDPEESYLDNSEEKVEDNNKKLSRILSRHGKRLKAIVG